MAINVLQDSRFLFPDMFSFSFDPEILTFLWGLCARKSEDGLEYRPFSPKSALLQVLVPSDVVQNGNFFTFLRYTFVTTGMVMVVSFSSYSTYKVLQKIRYEGFEGVKSWALNILASLKRPASKVRSLELVLRPRNNKSQKSDLTKRPSNLQLAALSNANNIKSNNNSNSNKSNGNGGRVPPSGVPNSTINVTPINGEIAIGDEDPEEVQSQYFGPSGNEDTPKRENHVSSPYSPESALKARYEAMDRSAQLSSAQQRDPS